MASSRLAVRLATLAPEVLAEYAASLCECFHQSSGADALLAQHQPLPGWCVDVLLSPDLLPHIMEPLALADEQHLTQAVREDHDEEHDI